MSRRIMAFWRCHALVSDAWHRQNGVGSTDRLGIGGDADTHVGGTGVGRVGRPGANPVAVAIGVVAQIRPAPDHPGTALVKPVGTPFPDIAGGVVEPKAVGPPTAQAIPATTLGDESVREGEQQASSVT